MKKGDRVRWNDKLPGKRVGKSKEGTVVGFSRDSTCVRVIWDNTKWPDDACHVSFVDVIEEKKL